MIITGNLSETQNLEPHSTPLVSEAVGVGPSHLEMVKVRLRCAND